MYYSYIVWAPDPSRHVRKVGVQTTIMYSWVWVKN